MALDVFKFRARWWFRRYVINEIHHAFSAVTAALTF